MKRARNIVLRKSIRLLLLGVIILGVIMGGNIEIFGGVMTVNSAAPGLIDQLGVASHYLEVTNNFIFGSTGLRAALGPVVRLIGLRRERPADLDHAITPATTHASQALVGAPNTAARGSAFVTNDLERVRIAPEGSVGVGWGEMEPVLDIQAGPKDTIIARFGRDNAGDIQSLAEIRAAKTLSTSGNEIGRIFPPPFSGML